MGTTPFRTFSGYLKQHSHETLAALEQELFDVLFPAFQGKNYDEEGFEGAQRRLQESGLSEKVGLLRPERRTRRFSGIDLGRSRYFSVSLDDKGNDMQTLAHELRAYRDPVDLGMVEVVDLAGGCMLSIQGSTVQFKPQPAFAVLIHEPERIPQKFHKLEFQEVPGLKESPIFVYRFPYRVMQYTIDRTVDLRDPEVRDWFFSTFRHPCDLCGAQLASGEQQGLLVPTTVHSRFHFENGRAPAPDSFWSMLPTLINPDLGGGNVGDTGSTLNMIGHWMRQIGVGALIYPSARCDTVAVVQGGVLRRWQGWNLLDYRDSPLLGGFHGNVVTFVVSPWAWLSLPSGVRLHVADRNSDLSGSFAIDGMVNYWAKDYMDLLKALEIARSIHGREIARDKRVIASEGLPYRAFRIGALSCKWVRMLVEQVPSGDIDNTVLELQGLALPFGMYLITGRILELWDEAKKGAITMGDALLASLGVIDLLCKDLANCYPQEDLEKVARVGADLENILIFLTLRKKSDGCMDDATYAMSGFLSEREIALTAVWLDKDLKTRVLEYYDRALHEMRLGGAETGNLIAEGEQFQRTIYGHLRSSPILPSH